MKKKIFPLLAGSTLFCSQLLLAQDFKSHESKEFALTKAVSANTLFVYNLNGFVKVEGYAGTRVLIEMDKTISAKSDSDLEKGKMECKMGFDQGADSVVVYIAAPYDTRPHERNSDYDDHKRIKYSFQVDFTIKVPFDMNLHISTVNKGEVTVANVNGVLQVHNVNGPITINNEKGTTKAHTINGNVTVDYLANPPEQSSYSTINGNISVNYQSGLSADLQFKSMHGEFYTDFEDTEILPASITKNQDKKEGGTLYKLNKMTAVRFGKGGKIYLFETLNGNVYIKKQS